MAYQRTWTAFNTESSAYHGGDPGWIRHANHGVLTRPSYGRPDLAGLGYGEEAVSAAGTAASTASTISTIAQVAQAAAALAQTGEAIYQQRQDQKAQRQQAAAANQAADKAVAANVEIAKIQAQTQAIQAAPTKEAGKNNKTLYLVGAGVAGLALLLFFVRRRTS